MTSFFIRTLLLVSIALIPYTLHGQKVRLPAVHRYTLENGLRVLMMEYTKVPVVHVRLLVRGGSALDPGGKEGVAATATALMRQGTSSRSAQSIAEMIDFTGGWLSVGASLDYCAASCEVLAKDVDTGLDLLADVVMNPVFDDAELERDRKQRLAVLEAMKEHPGSLASRAFLKTVYGNHPYGRSGTRSSIEKIQREELVDFHARFFTPNNAVLVVVGSVPHEEMIAKLRASFGKWNPGPTPEVTLPKPEPIKGRRVLLVDKEDVTQTQIRIGNTGVDVSNPDLFAIAVANTVFGSGFTSRLVEELRVKRSLTYNASSGFPSHIAGGTYSISTFTKNSTITEAIDVALQEVRKYRESGASADECRKAQSYIAGSFARSLQSPDALASQLTDIELYRFPQNHLETYIQNIKAVTREEVLRVARKYFLLDDLVIVLVSPASEAPRIAETYGSVTVLHIEDVLK